MLVVDLWFRAILLVQDSDNLINHKFCLLQENWEGHCVTVGLFLKTFKCG